MVPHNTLVDFCWQMTGLGIQLLNLCSCGSAGFFKQISLISRQVGILGIIFVIFLSFLCRVFPDSPISKLIYTFVKKIATYILFGCSLTKKYDGDGNIWVILYTYYDYKTVINPRSDILNNARVHFPCISNYNYILLLLKNYFQIISQLIVVFHLEFLSSNLLWPELPYFIHDFNQVSF